MLIGMMALAACRTGKEDTSLQVSELTEVQPSVSPLVDAAATVKPDETTKPDETAAPAETVKPAETAKPETTPKPEATQKPAETAKPEATKKPAETAKPEATKKPEATQKPAETAKPVQTQKPAETVKPAETAKPVQTQKPAETTKPAETQKPVEPTPAKTPDPTPTADPCANGHDWVQKDVWKEPTCLHGGTVLYECKKCGTTKAESTSKLPHEMEVESHRDGDCVEPAFTRYKCRNCEHFEDEYDDSCVGRDHHWVTGTYEEFDEELLEWVTVERTFCTRCNKDKE